MRLWSIRFVLGIYRRALWLYPRHFRQRYAGEISRCAAESLAETRTPLRTSILLGTDLGWSLMEEHSAMLTNNRALPQLAFTLVLTTFIAGTGYLISQQVLRMSANDPQIQLSEDGAERLSAGEDASHIVPERSVDISASLAPFVIVYDDAGKPLASSARLDGSIPAPPKGIFDYVRRNHQTRVTWQPRPGVRIASVMTRSSSGFVVAGRNMREVESREALVFNLAAVGWLAANLSLIAIWSVFWLVRRMGSAGIQPPQVAQ